MEVVGRWKEGEPSETGKMVTLSCVLVGVKGNAFPVTIDASKFVGELKDAIKGKKTDTIECEADKLELYLAKKGDAWLQSGSEDVKRLKKGEKTATIEELTREDKKLDGELGVDDALEGMPTPAKKQIHVLVVVPKSTTGEATGQHINLWDWESEDPWTNQPFRVDANEFKLSDHQPNSVVETKKLSHFFQEYGEFPSNYFIRQEEQMLWEIMLQRLADSTTITVIVGSPGVGKSIFLMLLGFYFALVKSQSVVILRSLKDQGWVYLYLDKQRFSRGTADVSNLRNLRGAFAGAWVFLDGFNDFDVNHVWSSVLRPFRVLATFCQYDNKSDDPAELVVLPAWRLKDLQAYALQTNWVKDVKLRQRKYAKVIPMLVTLQYFYSGGSMREFCRDHNSCMSRCVSVVRRIATDQKCLLLSGFGQESSQQVDRIRRHFIEDTSKPEHYGNSGYWQTSVDSGWVMRWLQVNREIGQVYEFYQYAKAIGAGFYGSAFECLFHHTIRQHHQTHTIVLMTSDTSNYAKVELEIDNVVCSGTGQKECHETLKSLSAGSYWHPSYAYLPFIDCSCRCRLVDRSGHTEEKFGFIQVTIARKKVFRHHRMEELEKIKQSNAGLCGFEAIYVVVTPSKATCDSFSLVDEDEVDENEVVEDEMDEYDLADFADVCPQDDESMDVERGEQVMQQQGQANSSWTQVITYLDPDAVYQRNDDIHLVRKCAVDQSLKKRREVS